MRPSNISLQDLTTAGIVYTWRIGIRQTRRKVAHYFATCIFKAHCSVILRPFLTNNCIFESGCFKSFVPVVDTCNNIRSPLFWCGRIHIVNNCLFGFYQFTFFIFFQVFLFWFEALADNEVLFFNFLLIVGKNLEAFSIVTYAGIGMTGRHLLTW